MKKALIVDSNGEKLIQTRVERLKEVDDDLSEVAKEYAKFKAVHQ